MTTATPILRSHRNLSHSRVALGVAIAVALGLPAMSGHAADPVQSPEPRASVSSPAPTSRAVTNCDDDGPGSLRSEVAAAASGDTIDLSALACSTITLTSGEIDVPLDDLAIVGPGADALAIDGSQASRVLAHTGAGTLQINGVSLRNGTVDTTSTSDTARGGCVISSGTVSLDHAAVSGCTTSAYAYATGGCVHATSLSASDSIVSGCLARVTDGLYNGYVMGGAIALTSYGSGFVDIKRSTISDSTARATNGIAEGGAIMISSGLSAASIEDSTLSGNAAVGAPYVAGAGFFSRNQGLGGAIFVASPITITGSTLMENSASSGGAIAQFANAYEPTAFMVHIVNSTISGNTASSMGGALWMFWNRFLIENSTVVLNSAEYGAGGIMPRLEIAYYADSKPSVLESTVVASNTSFYGAADIDPGNANFVITGSANFIGESDAEIPKDSLSGDPMLSPLSNNGGITLTHLPMLDSPLIDTGNNEAGAEFDQRGIGYPRIVGIGTDIGAVEFIDLSDLVFRNGFD